MATDEERREVAKRLRECRSGWSSGECYYTIIHALGLPDTSREDGGSALYYRLADLIDPDTTTDTTKDVPVSPITSPTVDRDALLALAEEMEWHAEGAYECDGMVNGGCLAGYADRIRDALGVSHADEEKA